MDFLSCPNRVELPKSVLSVWGQEIFFCMFIILCHKGCVIESVAESSLLSKDEPLTPNIDKVMAV